jgi:hypothetical protein
MSCNITSNDLPQVCAGPRHVTHLKINFPYASPTPQLPTFSANPQASGPAPVHKQPHNRWGHPEGSAQSRLFAGPLDAKAFLTIVPTKLGKHAHAEFTSAQVCGVGCQIFVR